MSEFEEELKEHYKKLEAEGLYDRKKHAYTRKFYAQHIKDRIDTFLGGVKEWWAEYEVGDRPLENVVHLINSYVYELKWLDERTPIVDREIYAKDLAIFYEFVEPILEKWKKENEAT